MADRRPFAVYFHFQSNMDHGHRAANYGVHVIRHKNRDKTPIGLTVSSPSRHIQPIHPIPPSKRKTRFLDTLPPKETAQVGAATGA